MTNRTVPDSPDAGKLHPYNHEARDGDIVVDVIRPSDLVAITVTARGATLDPPGGGGAAESTILAGDDARLYVDFPFQHLLEQASYEISDPSKLPDPMHPETTPPKPMPTVVVAPASEPARLRASRGSRLVFALPPGTRIPFSSAGILGAIPWLDAVLHPRGQAPGVRPPRYNPPAGIRIDILPDLPYVLQGGLIAHVSDAGVVISKQPAAEARAQLSGLLARRQLDLNARIVADAIARRGATLGRGVKAGDIVGPIGDLLDPGRVPPIRFPRPVYSRKATLDETAIEAPFRLQISPTSQGHWVHRTAPQAAGDAVGNVELWHTRLDTGTRTPDDLGRLSTPADDQTRVVRAVWTRDRDDLTDAQWRDPLADQDPKPGATSLPVLSPDQLNPLPPFVDQFFDPFLASLDRSDRHRLVRQTSESWPGARRTTIAPTPVGAEKLWLTALGAWMEFHGQWTTGPYSDAELASILAWDHIATGGRDQWVRVVYPGYLYPTGQPTVRVKLTERSIRPQTKPTAGLYQRQFLIVIDPVRTHGGFRLPFIETTLSPLVTPNLDPPAPTGAPGLGATDAFWPTVGGKPFSFRVDAEDREGRLTPFPAPLLWVAEHVKGKAQLSAIDALYATSPYRVIDMKGQTVAFTPKQATTDSDAGDARVETQVVRLRGTARPKGSDPWMSSADVVLPAAQALAGTGPTTITYFADYRENGYTAQNPGRVWAATVLGEITGLPAYKDVIQLDGATEVQDPVTPLPKVGFGGDPGDVGSDKAGGFIQPNLTVAGISTKQGAVGDLDSVAAATFDPAKLLGAALPKLFGLVRLTDIIDVGTLLDKAPALVTDALDSVTALIEEVERAKRIVDDAVSDAQQTAQSLIDKGVAAGSAQLTAAQQLATDAQALAAAYADLVAAVPDFIDALTGRDAEEIEAALNAAPGGIRPRLAEALAATKALARPPLPLFARTRLEQQAKVLGVIADGADLASDIYGFLSQLDLAKKQITFRYEWKPKLHSWKNETTPLLKLDPDSLLLAIRGTLKTSGPPDVEVLAELRRFTLILFASEPLMTIPFDHISFKAGSTGKPEIDVLIGEIVFGGLLEFVETIKDLIPLDGFSDPPFVDVTPAGLSAGFTLTLPNLAIGVFSLSNMSLGADVQVPFLGEALTVGFNFCTREKPFVLAVVFLGGGGWFAIRLSPKGLEILELGLEAGAYLAVDFGVASGSISAAIGLYIRLEGEKGSLTAYFRLRGEVDVLGLISASIELYMELVYRFDTGKMVGRARITVEVEVLCFSASVTIEAERQFAGSNGDPSLREVVMRDDGSAPDWDDYLTAFAKEEVTA